MTPGMLCALTCTSYRLHACTGVPRTFVWSLWVCRERPVSRSAVGRAGGGNQARETGRRRSGADPASAQHLHLVAWRGTGLLAVAGHIDQQRRRLVGAKVGWSATDVAISSSTANAVKSWSSPSSRATTFWLNVATLTGAATLSQGRTRARSDKSFSYGEANRSTPYMI